MTKRFALLWCSGEERNDYREEMLDTLKMENSEWDIISAFSDLTKIINSYDGFLISGSEFSVNDDKERFDGLFDFIRAAHKKEKPIVGICFGCQSLAVAFGGEVGFNPSGEFRFGTDEVKFIDGIGPKIGFETGSIKLIESHGECVATRPPGSVLLAQSESTAVEMFSVGGHVLGIQGHPELSKQTLERDFLKFHLEEGNVQESEVPRFEQQMAGYKPPESLRRLVKAVLQKTISLKDLVGEA